MTLTQRSEDPAEPAPQPPPRPPLRGKGLGSRAANAGLRALRSISPRVPWSARTHQEVLPIEAAAHSATASGRGAGGRSCSASEASLPELTSRAPVAPPRSSSWKRPSPRNAALTPRSASLQPSLEPVAESALGSRQLPALRQVPSVPPQTQPLVPPGAFMPGTAGGSARSSGTPMAAGASPKGGRRSLSARELSSHSTRPAEVDSGARSARGSSCGAAGAGRYANNGADVLSSWRPQTPFMDEQEQSASSGGGKLEANAQKLLDAVFDFPMAEEAASFMLGANPELAWLAQCVQRCPLPPCWSVIESRNGLEAPRYVDMSVGTVTDSPPLLEQFVELARVMLYWRSNPAQSSLVTERLAAKHNVFLSEAADVRRTWNGPHADPGTGFEYWYCHATQQSTWGDPGLAPEFLARVIDKLRQAIPTYEAEESATEKKASARGGKKNEAGWSKLPSWMGQSGQSMSSTLESKSSHDKESLNDVGAGICRERSSSRRKRSERKSTSSAGSASESEPLPRVTVDPLPTAPPSQDLHLRAGSQRRRPSATKLEPISRPPTPKASASVDPLASQRTFAAEVHEEVLEAPKPPPEIMSAMEAFKLEMKPKLQKPAPPMPTILSAPACAVAPASDTKVQVGGEGGGAAVAGSPEEDGTAVPVADVADSVIEKLPSGPEDSVIQKLDDIFDSASSGGQPSPAASSASAITPTGAAAILDASSQTPHKDSLSREDFVTTLGHGKNSVTGSLSLSATEKHHVGEDMSLAQDSWPPAVDVTASPHEGSAPTDKSQDLSGTQSPNAESAGTQSPAAESYHTASTSSYHTAEQVRPENLSDAEAHSQALSQTSIVAPTPVHSEHSCIAQSIKDLDESGSPGAAFASSGGDMSLTKHGSSQGAHLSCSTSAADITTIQEADATSEHSAGRPSDAVTDVWNGGLTAEISTAEASESSVKDPMTDTSAGFESGHSLEAEVLAAEIACVASSGSPSGSPSEGFRQANTMSRCRSVGGMSTISELSAISENAVAREFEDPADAKVATLKPEPGSMLSSGSTTSFGSLDVLEAKVIAQESLTDKTPSASSGSPTASLSLEVISEEQAQARGSPMPSLTSEDASCIDIAQEADHALAEAAGSPQSRQIVQDDMSIIHTSIIHESGRASASANGSPTTAFTPPERRRSQDDSSISHESDVSAASNGGLMSAHLDQDDSTSLIHEAEALLADVASIGQGSTAAQACSSTEATVKQPQRISTTPLTWAEQQGYSNNKVMRDLEDLTWGPAPAFEDISPTASASTARPGKSTTRRAVPMGGSLSEPVDSGAAVLDLPGAIVMQTGAQPLRPKKPPRGSLYRASPLRELNPLAELEADAQQASQGHSSRVPARQPKGSRPQGCSRVRLAPVGGA